MVPKTVIAKERNVTTTVLPLTVKVTPMQRTITATNLRNETFVRYSIQPIKIVNKGPQARSTWCNSTGTANKEAFDSHIFKPNTNENIKICFIADKSTLFSVYCEQ
eukprot:GHVR01126163.1.p2 GENE.GHVR01126163.1~~GHVR01126163.1.p2  ORF type:complete len:106 (-),score=0.07 GHVR01126163.1:49-366(-)